jgi:hypothetical protein
MLPAGEPPPRATGADSIPPNRLLTGRPTVADDTDTDTETDTPAEPAEAVEAEAAAEPDVAEEPVAEAEVVEEPVAEAEPEPMDEATEAAIAAEFEGEAAEEYEAEEAAVAVATAAGPSVARVYICKHGHRTVSLWSVPETCLRRVRGHVCGEAVVPLADAPADAKEKMLNPLKASKKAAKKS